MHITTVKLIKVRAEIDGTQGEINEGAIFLCYFYFHQTIFRDMQKKVTAILLLIESVTSKLLYDAIIYG